MNKKTDFIDEVLLLMKKHKMKEGVYLVNIDTNEVVQQVCLGLAGDERDQFVVGYSPQGNILCPCCKEENK